MVNGFTSIGIVRKGGSMEVQKWPNLATTSQLRKALEEHSVQGWNFTWDSEGGGMPERAWIQVEKVEIVYKGAGKDLWALKHVQGVSLPGAYFDGKHYPMHEYLSNQIVEPDDPTEDYSLLAQQLARVMPGLSATVPYPCDCKKQGDGSVWGVIQHLNDQHHPARPVADKWSRERIADWTEELPVDLTVDPSRAEKRQEAWAHAQKQQEAIKKWISEPAIVDQKFLDELTGTAKGKEEA